MDLMKLFKDEALIEILEFGDMSIAHEDERTAIFVTPHDKCDISKIQMQVMLDFFIDYDISLNLIDDPFFVVEDYKKLDG